MTVTTESQIGFTLRDYLPSWLGGTHFSTETTLRLSNGSDSETSPFFNPTGRSDQVGEKVETTQIRTQPKRSWMSSLNPCNLPGIRSIVPEFLTGYRTETTHDGKTAEERLAAKKEAKLEKRQRMQETLQSNIETGLRKGLPSYAATATRSLYDEFNEILSCKDPESAYNTFATKMDQIIQIARLDGVKMAAHSCDPATEERENTRRERAAAWHERDAAYRDSDAATQDRQAFADERDFVEYMSTVESEWRTIKYIQAADTVADKLQSELLGTTNELRKESAVDSRAESTGLPTPPSTEGESEDEMPRNFKNLKSIN